MQPRPSTPILRISLVLMFAVIAGGCAIGPMVRSHQSDCEAKHNAFAEMVPCLKTAIASDANTRLRDNERVKLYVLMAEALKEMVVAEEMGETEARLRLQAVMVRFQDTENVERARALQGFGAGLQQMGNSLQQMQPPPSTIRPPIHCNTINMGSGYSTTNCY